MKSLNQHEADGFSIRTWTKGGLSSWACVYKGAEYGGTHRGKLSEEDLIKIAVDYMRRVKND